MRRSTNRATMGALSPGVNRIGSGTTAEDRQQFLLSTRERCLRLGEHSRGGARRDLELLQRGSAPSSDYRIEANDAPCPGRFRW